MYVPGLMRDFGLNKNKHKHEVFFSQLTFKLQEQNSTCHVMYVCIMHV